MSEINRSEQSMNSDINKSKGGPKFVMAMAEGQTVLDASTEAGISKRTGYRRMQKQEWHNAIQETRAQMVELAVDFAASILVDTLNTVTEIKEKTDNDSVKLRASKLILQFAAAQMNQVQVNDWDESPVEQEKQLNFRALNKEELKLFLALMAKLEGEDESAS